MHPIFQFLTIIFYFDLISALPRIKIEVRSLADRGPGLPFGYPRNLPGVQIAANKLIGEEFDVIFEDEGNWNHGKGLVEENVCW